MTLEFKAEMIDGVLHVKPIIEKRGDNTIIHVPSFKLMQELKNKETYPNGKRNIQQV